MWMSHHHSCLSVSSGSESTSWLVNSDFGAEDCNSSRCARLSADSPSSLASEESIPTILPERFMRCWARNCLSLQTELNGCTNYFVTGESDQTNVLRTASFCWHNVNLLNISNLSQNFTSFMNQLLLFVKLLLIILPKITKEWIVFCNWVIFPM